MSGIADVYVSPLIAGGCDVSVPAACSVSSFEAAVDEAAAADAVDDEPDAELLSAFPDVPAEPPQPASKTVPAIITASIHAICFFLFFIIKYSS